MKNYKIIIDVMLLLGLAALAFFTIMPQSVSMSNDMQMMFMVIIFILTSIFLVLVWNENPKDERERQNQAIAGRYAYLVSIFMLLIMLVVDVMKHTLDPLLPISLFVVIAVKLLYQRASNDNK